MKKIGILTIILCVAISLFAQNKKMTLKGECPSMKNGEKLYLVMGGAPRDSAVVNNGKFEFALNNIKPEESLIVRTNKEGKEECVLFYLDYCDTYMKLEAGTTNVFNTDFINCTVTGNPTDAVVREINNLFFFSNDPGALINDPDFTAKLSAIADRGDMASAYVLDKYQQIVFEKGLAPKVKACLEKMSPEVRESAAGKRLRQAYERLAPTVAGAVAPDFTLNTPEGKPVTMSEYVKGKKLVLIDFWASWCGPCRKEGENVKAIYKDFHDKGFDVLGVSLDSKLEDWKKAIKEDGITWGQVSDLQGWKTPLTKLYNFNGIPHLVLVDGNGRIVAKNLRGEALRQKVAEICK